MPRGCCFLVGLFVLQWDLRKTTYTNRIFMFWFARFHWLNLFAFGPWFWRWRSCTFLLPPGSRFCHGNPANCYLASGTAKHSQLFFCHGSITCQTRPSCPLCHRHSSLQYCTSSVSPIPTPCPGRSVWDRWKTGSACARECDPPSHPCHALTSQGMLLLAAFVYLQLLSCTPCF